MPTSETHTVLLVQPFAHHFGHHWQVTKNLRDALREAGVKVDTVAFSDPIQDQLTDPDLFLAATGRRGRTLRKLARWFGKGAETMACLRLTSRLVGERQYDAIHFIDGTHLPLLTWTLLHRSAVIYTLWGGPGELIAHQVSRLKRLKQKLTRYLFARAMHTGRFGAICETEEVRLEWEPILGRDVHLVPYAVQPVAGGLDRQAARRRLGLPVGDPVFLLFGTHRRGKDYGLVFEAAQQPALAGQAWLLFVGKVVSGNSPSLLASQYGYSRVRMVDQFVPQESVQDYFSAADMVILPYHSGYVKGSGVLIESCRYGRPVIVAGVGYLRKFVQEHGVGLVYACGDAGDLARQMKKATEMTDQDKEDLDSHLRHVVQEYSWPRVVSRYIALYGQYMTAPVGRLR